MQRILTYNLQHGAGLAGTAPTRFAAALAGRRATVIACQEVLAPRDGGDQASRLAAELDMHATWMPNATLRAGRLGNALLSLQPPLVAGRLDVSLPGVEPRGVLCSQLVGGITIWNVHLGLTHRERRAQWQTIECALPPPESPLIVCGDFNDWSGRLGPHIRAAGLRDALDGVPRRRRRTFPARLPLVSLDRIYYRGLQLVRAAVLGAEPWARLSDHRPVEADFILEPRHGAPAGDVDRVPAC